MGRQKEGAFMEKSFTFYLIKTRNSIWQVNIYILDENVNYLDVLCLVDKIFQDIISTAENNKTAS